MQAGKSNDSLSWTTEIIYPEIFLAAALHIVSVCTEYRTFKLDVDLYLHQLFPFLCVFFLNYYASAPTAITANKLLQSNMPEIRLHSFLYLETVCQVVAMTSEGLSQTSAHLYAIRRPVEFLFCNMPTGV